MWCVVVVCVRVLSLQSFGGVFGYAHIMNLGFAQASSQGGWAGGITALHMDLFLCPFRLDNAREIRL